LISIQSGFVQVVLVLLEMLVRLALPELLELLARRVSIRK
jgi:hypothetical protein